VTEPPTQGAVILPFIQPKVHVHRDRYKKPIIQTGELRADGKPRAHTCTSCDKSVPGIPYRRATTYIDVLEDRYKLEKWKQRGVAVGLAKVPALLTAVSAAINNDRELDRLCDEALERAGTSDKATHGTAVHALAEQLDAGQRPLVPPHVQPDIDAYAAATKGMNMLDIETFVVVDDLQVAGTFDRLIEYDGQRYIGDLKTGSIEYGLPKITMQLAMYAKGKRYDPLTGIRNDLDVDQDYGIVIHLPAGQARCEIKWVDLSKGRNGIERALAVWDWRKADGRDFIVAAPAFDLLGMISLCGDVDSLTRLWSAYRHLWNDEAQAAAVARKAEIIAAGGAGTSVNTVVRLLAEGAARAEAQLPEAWR